jgi:hypothetical protein
MRATQRQVNLTIVAVQRGTPCGLISGCLRPEVLIDFAVTILV